MSRIVILGAGAWGTAIALSLTRRGGHNVTLWAHNEHEARVINSARENTLFLPGFPLPRDLAVTAEMTPIETADILVSVIPSEFLRSTLDADQRPSPQRTVRRQRHQGNRKRNPLSHDPGDLSNP